jgi:hypothetical protein
MCLSVPKTLFVLCDRVFPTFPRLDGPLALHAQRIRTRLTAPAQAVLGYVQIILVRVDQAARLGHSQYRRELASHRVTIRQPHVFWRCKNGKT